LTKAIFVDRGGLIYLMKTKDKLEQLYQEAGRQVGTLVWFGKYILLQDCLRKCFLSIYTTKFSIVYNMIT
jgi:hypothetical protein